MLNLYLPIDAFIKLENQSLWPCHAVRNVCNRELFQFMFFTCSVVMNSKGYHFPMFSLSVVFSFYFRFTHKLKVNFSCKRNCSTSAIHEPLNECSPLLKITVGNLTLFLFCSCSCYCCCCWGANKYISLAYANFINEFSVDLNSIFVICYCTWRCIYNGCVCISANGL